MGIDYRIYVCYTWGMEITGQDKDQSMRQYTIYALVAANHRDVVMYVGATCAPVRNRLSKHYTEAIRRRNTSPCSRWIKRNYLEGVLVSARVIEVCKESEWEEKERKWIRYYRLRNPDLLNRKPGGLTSRGV